jgi:hypothetical protein
VFLFPDERMYIGLMKTVIPIVHIASESESGASGLLAPYQYVLFSVNRDKP